MAGFIIKGKLNLTDDFHGQQVGKVLDEIKKRFGITRLSQISLVEGKKSYPIPNPRKSCIRIRPTQTFELKG